MGVITQTLHDSFSGGTSRVVRITLTSDASGDDSITETLHGLLVRCVSNPSVTAPTADWDFYLNDVDGVDLLAGGGVDRHTSTSEMAALPNNFPVRIDGAVTIVGANMGNAKIADVVLYLLP